MLGDIWHIIGLRRWATSGSIWAAAVSHSDNGADSGLLYGSVDIRYFVDPADPYRPSR